MKRFILALALISAPISAQVTNPPASAPLPTSFSGTTCTNCTMANPIFTGTPSVNGKSIATTDALPSACASVPPADSVAGSIGSGTPCTIRPDATRPAMGLWTKATTDVSCNISWTFGRTFTTPVISIATQDSGMPVLWNITSISGTAVTLKAYRLQILPASLTLVTALASFNVAAGTCSGIIAHIGVREQLVP